MMLGIKYLIFSILPVMFCCDIGVKGRESKKEEKNVNSTSSLMIDTLPSSLYERINEISFVKEKLSSLKEQGLSSSFYNLKEAENKSDFYVVQLVSTDRLRMTPLFTLHYYLESDSLLHLDTTIDSLSLIPRQKE